MRSKINDYFEFPEEIDMSPYNVEYLKDTRQSIAPDLFKLVGVLVHSGNAESGHYYSYIRERPVEPGNMSAWVEFNDGDVTRFDPKNIPDQCFGGFGDNMGYSQMQFPKTWNAYMLFYQRSSSMDDERKNRLSLLANVQAKEGIPIQLNNAIAFENAQWIRRFCLFDPEHARFMKSLLEQYRDLSRGICSDDHKLEKQVIWLALEHLDQIFSRSKDHPEFHAILDILIKIAGSCPTCCKLTIDWVVQHEHALRNLLLRSPDEEIRKRFAKMIVGALLYLRENDTLLYGLDPDGFETELDANPKFEVEGAFPDVARKLRDLWSYLHLHSKAWDDYYDLVNELALLGRMECHVLHRESFLSHILEVLIIDFQHPIVKRLRLDSPHHTHYFRLAEKGRKFSLRNMIGLLATLLQWTNFEIEPTESDSDESRQILNHGYLLRRHEECLISFGIDITRTKAMVFLDKALSLDCNIIACQSIIRTLVAAEQFLHLSQAIKSTIVSGVNIDPAANARPYLLAALTYCETCAISNLVVDTLYIIAHEVGTIGSSGGEEHLEFFVRARRIRNDRLPRRNPNFFQNQVLTLVPNWAPTLLMYCDGGVREETIALLQALIFNFDIHSMDDEEQADRIQSVAKSLCRACLKRINELVILPGTQVDAKAIEDIVKVVRHCIMKYFHEDESETERATIDEAHRKRYFYPKAFLEYTVANICDHSYPRSAAGVDGLESGRGII